MSATRVAIYGAGSLGRQLCHYVRAHLPMQAELRGFVDDTRAPGDPVSDDLVNLGPLSAVAADPRHQGLHLVFAIGYADMQQRGQALQRALDSGLPLYTLVHPSAIIEPGVVLGPGCVVLAQAVLDQQVQVGAGCYVDIGVRLTNGTNVGRNNWLSSGTATGSRVRIGDNCFFGMDCTVTTDVTLGSNLFVNAKTLVPRDVGSDLKIVEAHKTIEIPIAR